MKKSILFIVCVCLFSGIAFVSAQAADEILLLTDERPPFEFTASDGSVDGIAVKATRCILEKMNRPYTIKVTAWKRAQANVKGEKADGFFAASRNNARDEYATLSDITCDQYWNWYTLKNSSFTPDSPDFKKNARVASWFGSNSLKWLNKNGYKVTSSPNTSDVLVKQLVKGRVDAIFGSNFAIEEFIQKMNVGDKINTTRGLSKPMGVYFSKKFLGENPGFLNEFNRHINQCKP